MYKWCFVMWIIMIGCFICKLFFNMYINFSVFCFNNFNVMKKFCFKCFFCFGFFLIYLFIIVDDFYLFGNENGDLRLLRGDDEIL